MYIKRILSIIIFCSVFFVSPYVYAATDGISFVSSPLWLSNASPNEGDTVTLYAALVNKGTVAITTSVSFYDGTTIIGTRTAVVAAAQAGTFSITTRVTAGEHVFHATIQKAKLSNGHDAPQASLSEADVSIPVIFVAKTVLPAQASAADSAAGAATPLGAINNLQDKITSFVPISAKNALTELFSTLDSGRSGASVAITKSRDALQHTVDVKKLKDAGVIAKTPEEIAKDKADSLNPGSVFTRAVQTPWQYVKLTILDILAFIFGNKYIFYPLCALLLFFFIRFIWRRIRR